MKILILAGGSGTRLWPLSRRNHPKQFLKLFGGRSLLQTTAERFGDIAKPEDFIVITNKAYEFDVRSDLPWLEHIILEPVGRNTAPAIALAARYATERLGCGPGEVIFVSPSDHLIEPIERFVNYVRLSQDLAQSGYLVTFGIKPTKPETGYGYIKAAAGSIDIGHVGAFPVDAFVEKPDLPTAERYLADGHYFWNSGMFAFTTGVIEDEFSAHAPQIASALALGYDGMMASFDSMPFISIDYAVMEKSRRVAVIPVDLNWNDVGSWDSVFDMAPAACSTADPDKVISIDSENIVVLGDSRIIAAIGLTDCVIVDTPDALLVAKKGHGQKVKKVMDRLVDEGRKEAAEHVTTQRPWGSFTNLLEMDGYKAKRIVVNPGGKLSLQYHKHRCEHWVVAKGRAKVTIGEKEQFIDENGSVYIPATVPHRMENCEITPLEIIEVQYGNYLGENDIVRLEDVYGRSS